MKQYWLRINSKTSDGKKPIGAIDMAFATILAFGLGVAILTNNTGNFFIFVGLSSVVTSGYVWKVDGALLNFGRFIYLVGFVWSLFQGEPAAIAGWGSVFATLFIGTFA